MKIHLVEFIEFDMFMIRTCLPEEGIPLDSTIIRNKNDLGITICNMVGEGMTFVVTREIWEYLATHQQKEMLYSNSNIIILYNMSCPEKWINLKLMEMRHRKDLNEIQKFQKIIEKNKELVKGEC